MAPSQKRQWDGMPGIGFIREIKCTCRLFYLLTRRSHVSFCLFLSFSFSPLSQSLSVQSKTWQRYSSSNTNRPEIKKPWFEVNAAPQERRSTNTHQSGNINGTTSSRSSVRVSSLCLTSWSWDHGAISISGTAFVLCLATTKSLQLSSPPLLKLVKE